MGKNKQRQAVEKQPVNVAKVQKESMPEVPVGFIVSLGKEYLVSWGRKDWTNDKAKAKVLSKANAEFIANEIKGKYLPV